MPDELENQEPVTEPEPVEPVEEPAEPAEETETTETAEDEPVKETAPEFFLEDGKDLRLRTREDAVKSYREARRTIGTLIHEKRTETAEKERLQRENEALKVQVGLKPQAPAPEDKKPLAASFKERIAKIPNPNEDFDGYTSSVRDLLGGMAEAIESRPAPSAEEQRRIAQQVVTEAKTAESLQERKERVAKEIDEVCLNNPELYLNPDVTQEEVEVILRDPSHPDRDKLQNAIELLRMAEEHRLPISEAHVLVAAKRGIAVAPVKGKQPDEKHMPEKKEQTEYDRQKAARAATLRAPSAGTAPGKKPEEMNIHEQLEAAKRDFLRAK